MHAAIQRAGEGVGPKAGVIAVAACQVAAASAGDPDEIIPCGQGRDVEISGKGITRIAGGDDAGE